MGITPPLPRARLVNNNYNNRILFEIVNQYNFSEGIHIHTFIFNYYFSNSIKNSRRLAYSLYSIRLLIIFLVHRSRCHLQGGLEFAVI